MWKILAVYFLAAMAALAACGPPNDGSLVNFKFDNKTDSLVCAHSNAASAASGQSCSEVKPRKTTVWSSECLPGEDRDRTLVTMVLTVGVKGRAIYNRTATCKQWNDLGASIIIDQTGDRFIIKDSLPGATPSP
jgi:hypothetical protein